MGDLSRKSVGAHWATKMFVRLLGLMGGYYRRVTSQIRDRDLSVN
jgi:hypothetical protein